MDYRGPCCLIILAYDVPMRGMKPLGGAREKVT